jgi:hypothetical protein
MRAALALIALILVAGCAATHDVNGTFVLTDDAVTHGGGSCQGTGGYADIQAGLTVTVKDASGKIIATSRLVDDDANSPAGKCSYTFAVQVPDADFYAFEVGHRGELTYSRDELEGMDWDVGFTLGD